jgi:hypothetical protein
VLLHMHIPGASEYEIGNEIWHQSLAEAIAAEAQTIASNAGPELLDSPDQAHRDTVRDQIICDMTLALVEVGDEHQAPDSVRYFLIDEPVCDADTLGTVHSQIEEPVVTEVLRFEDTSRGIRRQPSRHRALKRRHRERGPDPLRRRDALL